MSWNGIFRKQKRKPHRGNKQTIIKQIPIFMENVWGFK
jgi:hypothetical protein